RRTIVATAMAWRRPVRRPRPGSNAGASETGHGEMFALSWLRCRFASSPGGCGDSTVRFSASYASRLGLGSAGYHRGRIWTADGADRGGQSLDEGAAADSHDVVNRYYGLSADRLP